MKRRIIIGAIGGDKQEKPAIDFGEAVACADCILLTGGGNKVSDQVKDASVLGAKNVAQKKRCIGSLCRHIAIERLSMETGKNISSASYWVGAQSP